MRLGFVFVNNYQNVNYFNEVPSIEISNGNPDTIYFRIVNLDTKDSNGKFLRYIPASGSIVSVMFNNIDSTKIANKIASMVSVDDRSIYSVAVMPTDILSSQSFEATLTEGSNVIKLKPIGMLVINQAGSGSNYC
jgi:hypothetical protein